MKQKSAYCYLSIHLYTLYMLMRVVGKCVFILNLTDVFLSFCIESTTCNLFQSLNGKLILFRKYKKKIQWKIIIFQINGIPFFFVCLFFCECIRIKLKHRSNHLGDGNGIAKSIQHGRFSIQMNISDFRCFLFVS